MKSNKRLNGAMSKRAAHSPKSFAPNPLLDNFLVSLFFIEAVAVGCMLQDQGDMLALLFVLIAAVGTAVAVTKTAFRVGGLWLSRSVLKAQHNPLRKKTTMKKWCDQSWQLMIHISMSIFETYILSGTAWWDDRKQIWLPYVQASDYDLIIRVLYITQLSIWFYTAFSCKFQEEVRKDYLIMMSHHVVTIALVALSYGFGHLRVGVMILWIHDVSDVPLDLLKMFNYLKLEGSKGLYITEICFVVLFVSWVYFRLFLFPFDLIYCTVVESRLYLEASASVEAVDFSNLFPDAVPLYLVFNLLLITLFLLHIWWFFLIVRLVFGILTKGSHQTGKDEYEGTSSESESECDKEE